MSELPWLPPVEVVTAVCSVCHRFVQHHRLKLFTGEMLLCQILFRYMRCIISDMYFFLNMLKHILLKILSHVTNWIFMSVYLVNSKIKVLLRSPCNFFSLRLEYFMLIVIVVI